MTAALILSVPFIILSVSCRKFIEVEPPLTGLNGSNVYTTDATAAAVLTDIYAQMSARNASLTDQSITSIPLYVSLGADELILYDLNAQNLAGYYRNELHYGSHPSYWNAIYPQIYASNSAIAGLNESTQLTPALKQQLLGEAKFIRAFCYFYLVNMFGDVSLVLDLDYKANALLPRAPVAQVYEQIILDLKEAQELLSIDYLQGDALTAYPSGSEERVRPTKWAATALLARVYLYTGDNDNAATEASKVIDHATLYNLGPLNQTFLKNNQEAIWQLQPVRIEANPNSGEGRLFVLPPSGPNTIDHFVYLSPQVVNSFETDDQRKTNWVDSVIVDGTTYYYPYKYKIGNVAAPMQEYPTILRLAEQYLIRAEARAAQNNIAGAQSDLNIIRSRAGLPNTTAADKTTLLHAILQERRVELFTEWGHRWFDLKRTGQLDAVMQVVAPLKGSSWKPYQALYPIPQEDLNRDPNLVQNPGYNQ